MKYLIVFLYGFILLLITGVSKSQNDNIVSFRINADKYADNILEHKTYYVVIYFFTEDSWYNLCVSQIELAYTDMISTKKMNKIGIYFFGSDYVTLIYPKDKKILICKHDDWDSFYKNDNTNIDNYNKIK